MKTTYTPAQKAARAEEMARLKQFAPQMNRRQRRQGARRAALAK